MNSYKCSQCGLTNWVTTEFCKKCKSPNPQFVYTQQTAAFTDDPQYDGYSNQQNYQQQNYDPYRNPTDYSAPPPPNAFGNSAGTANYGQYQPTNYGQQPYQGYDQSYLSDSDRLELQNAQRKIRKAWIAGAVVTGLSLLVAVLFSILVSGQTRGQLKTVGNSSELILSAIVFGGLSIGIYRRSRICAALLCTIYILEKIWTIAVTGKVAGIAIGLLFIYYFVGGVQGTFDYHRIMKGKR
ncbi:MAG: hypothetical protein LUM44_14890 [Pyrinomonadaceae bacterium]|nr:hypothetical protein [Pyrinomonadaceae bacterium]